MECGKGKDDTWFCPIGGGKLKIEKQTVNTIDGWTCAYSRLLDDNKISHNKENTNAPGMEKTVKGREFETVLNETGMCCTTILAVKCGDEIVTGSDGRRTRAGCYDGYDEIISGNAKKIFTIDDKYLSTISGITYYSLRLIDFLNEHAKTSSFFELCRLAQKEVNEWERLNNFKRYPATISLIGFANKWSRSRVEFIGNDEQEDKKTIHIYAAGSGGEIAEKRLQELIEKKEVDLKDINSIRKGIRIAILQSGIQCPFTGGRMNEGTVSRDKIPKLGVERPHQLSLFKLHYTLVVWPKAYIFTSVGPTTSEILNEYKVYLKDIPKVKEVRILGRSGYVIYWMILTSFGFTPPPLDSIKFNLFRPMKLLKLDRQALEDILADDHFSTTNEDQQW